VVVTAGAIMLMVVVYVLWPRNVAQTLTGRDTVVLAFDNTTGDTVFDGALRLALAVQLGQSPFLRLLADSRVREELQFMGRPPSQPVTRALALEICQREGARAVIAGTLATLGRQYVIGLEAVDCRSGDTLARQQAEAASKEAILNSVGRAASSLRRDLGESLASLQRFDVPLVQATTPSLQALKAFSQAEEARQADYPQTTRAEALYRQALELDPQFALAYARLGTLLRLGLQREEGVQMFMKAYELRDRVSEAERYDIVTQYHASVTGERDRAHEAYLVWRAAYPRSWLAWYGLAADQLQEGRFREAIDGCARALPLAPNPALPALCVARAQMALNDFDAAETTFQDAFKRGVKSPAVHIVHWLNAFARGDQTAMEAEIRWSTQSAETQLELMRGKAWAAMSFGRLAEGRAALRAAFASAHTVPDGVARVYLDEAYLEGIVGDPRAARVAAQQALAAAPNADLRAMAAAALAGVGDLSAAGAVIEQATPGPDDLFQRIVITEVRALIDLWRGRPADAVKDLEASRRFELGIYAQLIPIGLRADAHLRAGQLVEAIDAYRTIIAHRGIQPTVPQGPLAYLGLARAHALAQHPDEARKAYEEFLSLWKDADADAPLLLRARAELAKLH
jgi:tetratricopeptide (TPR) repeat protein